MWNGECGIKGRFTPIVLLTKCLLVVIILQVRHSLNGRRLQSLPSKGGVAYGISCYFGSYFNSGNRLYSRNKKEITALLSQKQRAIKS